MASPWLDAGEELASWLDAGEERIAGASPCLDAVDYPHGKGKKKQERTEPTVVARRTGLAWRLLTSQERQELGALPAQEIDSSHTNQERTRRQDILERQ